jgi:hypothetical protein
MLKKVSHACLRLSGSPRIHIGILVLVTCMLSMKDITRGDFRHPDAWAHAMNGVYLLDLVKAMPIGRLWDFSLNYFAKYPAISLPYHPPGFPMFEAIIFAIFGISVATARFAVVLCAILAVVFWYRLVEATHSRAIALCSGLFLISNSSMVILCRQVMLEIPTLAVLVLSIYFLQAAISSKSRASLYWWAVTAGAVVWVKQTAGFVVPLSLSYFLLKWKCFRPKFRDFAVSLGILLAGLIPMTYITYYFARSGLVQAVGGTRRLGFTRSSMANWLYYIRLIPDSVPTVILVAALASFVLVVLRKRWDRHLIYLFWFLWSYIFISFFAVKDTRYAFFLIPPIYLFACSWIDEIVLKVKGYRLDRLILGVLCLLQCGFAYRTQTHIIGGFEEAARFVKENWRGQSVIVSARWHGSFTFNVRKLDPDGPIMVLRAEKALPELYGPALTWKKEPVYGALRSLGAKYIVIESRDWDQMLELKRLRDIVGTGHFALRKSIPVTGNMTSYQNVNILIYEFLEEVDGTKEFLTMPMPKMKKRLVIPLKGKE